MNHLKLNDKKEFKFEERKSSFFKKKKTYYEVKRPRFSSPFTAQRRKITSKSPNSNKILVKKMTHTNFGEPHPIINPGIDFKGIEKEIKNNLLEMKDECLKELKLQSCGTLELYFKQPISEELSNDSNKRNSIPGGLSKEKRKKTYRRSKTNSFDINNGQKRRSIKKNRSKKKSIHECVIKRFSKIKENSSIPRRYLSTEYVRLNNFKRKSIPADKFRFYSRGGMIEDSLDEDESEEELDNHLINPETTQFFIYDTLICLASFYSLIYIPCQIISEFLCEEKKNDFKVYINLAIDILFIFDLIIHFFLKYYNKQEILVKSWKKVISKYLKGYFFFDLLASLPINIIYYYYTKNMYTNCHSYESTDYIFFLSILKCLKSIKVFKITGNKQNQLISQIIEKIPDSASNALNLITQTLLIIFGLHVLSCIHIYIGQHAYPGWIFSNKFENFSILNLYLISFYYLITTMTTVGYGDVSSDSFTEIIFRIILLAVGILCYSWLISNISNGINRQSYASINFANDAQILENIRKEHRDLHFEVYKEIKQHLEYKHFHQQIYDKNLLIDNLPFSLKNNLLFSMYTVELQNFDFFQGISNTSFLSEILYNFYPLICKKNEILLNENEIIEDVYFVREGRISLEIPIDMNDPKKSVNDYLSKEFMDFAFNFKENDSPNIIGTNISNHSITSLFSHNRISLLDEKAKNTISKKNIENNIFYLKIFDIHKNEDYGGVHLFYGKRTPFAVKAKTKRVLLYTIKDVEFSNLSDTYKNIIKRINRKKKKIIKLIKNVLIITIDKFCKSNGIKIKEEYKEEIKRAINEINTKNTPDYFKETTVVSSTNNEIENEINLEINETVRQFNETFSRLTSIKSLNQKMISLDKIRKSQMSEIRSPKRSFNFRGSLGATIIQGFKPNYYGNYKSTKKLTDVNTENINKELYKSIIDKKNQLTFQIQKNINSNTNTILKPISNYNDSNSSSTMKNIDFIESDSNKSNLTQRTIKIKKEENENESTDSGPKTMKILPKSLQISLKDKIKNYQNLNQSDGFFKIEHISVEINNNLNKINNNNNNKINFSKIATQKKNISYSNIMNENGIINSDNDYSDMFNSINPKNKNIDIHSSLIPIRMRQKVFNKSKKNVISKKESTNNSSRLTASPNISPYNISNLINNNNLSPVMNPKRKSLFSQKNISNKLEETLIFSNKKLNFENISSTSADSFEIKSSYKNLNQISEGDYIKNKNLQKKTIKFIKNYEKEKNIKKTKKIDLKALMKGNKDEDHFKKIEEEVHTAKTKIAKYLLKKNKILEKNNDSKSLKINVNDSFKSQLKFGIKNNRNSNDNIDFNNSSLIGINSIIGNPDDTLTKLNCNEAIKNDFKENSKFKKKNIKSLTLEKKK